MVAHPEEKRITLPAEEATVQERSVTIRVLTIGTRQITQTLYRQLVWEHVVDQKTGLLKGEVWGWVNLHDKDCYEETHLHVIWEDNGMLKRSETKRTHCTRHWESLLKRLSRLALIYVCLVALDGKKFSGQKTEDEVILTVKGRRIHVDVPYPVRELWERGEWIKQHGEDPTSHPSWCSSREVYVEWIYNTKKRGLEGILENNILRREMDLSQYTSHSQTYEEMEDTATEMNIFEENYENSYKVIEDAGQLFVAVSGVWK